MFGGDTWSGMYTKGQYMKFGLPISALPRLFLGPEQSPRPTPEADERQQFCTCIRHYLHIRQLPSHQHCPPPSTTAVPDVRVRLKPQEFQRFQRIPDAKAGRQHPVGTRGTYAVLYCIPYHGVHFASIQYRTRLHQQGIARRIKDTGHPPPHPSECLSLQSRSVIHLFPSPFHVL